MENNYVIAPTGDRLGWVSEGDETATDGAYDADGDAEMPPESSFLDVMTRVALLLMDIHRPTLPTTKQGPNKEEQLSVRVILSGQQQQQQAE